MAPQDISLAEFDEVVKDYKGRKLGEVADAERMRREAERSRDEAQKESAVLNAELAKAKHELSQTKSQLAQHKADWDASVKRIQVVLEAREQQIVKGEKALKERETAIGLSSDRNRHQWTLLREAVDNFKVAVTKHQADQGKAFDAILKTLPSGSDRPA